MCKWYFLRTALVSLFVTASAMAQSAGGATVQGTVKEASGAVIPGATLTITRLDTSVRTSTVSNHDGYFVTPALPIGKYRVRCEATGMKAWEQEVQLETGQTLEINPILLLGAVNETVLVTDTVPLVTTTDPTDATTLDSQRIKELPINGRDLNTLLAEVTPGVEQIIDVNGGVRTGGLMVYSTDYRQDGAAANNREFGGSTGLQGLESIGEVRIETSSGNAKSASPTSVIVNTRGGTNRYRVGVYETIRNNGWGVARARQDINPNGSPFQVPKLIRNEYGGSIGGPIVLPTFGLNGRRIYDGHNRTFFFVSREYTALRQGIVKDYEVPTAAMRRGDFNGLTTNLGVPITLYDPLTGYQQTVNNRPITMRAPFPNNIIPVDRESPLAKYIYRITPLPSDITQPNITTNLKYAFATSGIPNVNDNPTTIRVDHRLSERDSFFVKTNWGQRTSYFQGTGSNTGVATANLEANVTDLIMTSYGAALSENHVFSSTFFVETLLNRSWQTSKTIDGPVNAQANFAQQLGLPNPYGQIGWPSILNDSFTQYVEGDNRRALGSTITNAQQNYSWIKGTHTIQFGWAYHYETQRLLPDQGNISGTANFNSLATALESSTTGTVTAPAVVQYTGYDAANFFLGYAANYNVYLTRGTMKVDEKNYAFYLQDNYKVNGRLTLTPGLRWDVSPAFVDEHHLVNTFDLKNHAIELAEPLDYYYKIGATTPEVVANFQKVNVKFESAKDIGKSSQLFPSNLFDFGPRMGAAYRLFDDKKSFIIRGAYGLYISALPMRTLLAQFSSMAPFKANFSYNPNSAAQSPDGNGSWLLRNEPTYIAGLNSANSVNLSSPTALGVGQSVVALDPNLPSSRIHEWNAEIEKQIGSSMVMRIKYDGKHGADLDQLNEINGQAPDYIWYTETGLTVPGGTLSSVTRRPYDQNAYTSVRLFAKTGSMNSEMGAIEFERRFSRGLQFQVFYTLMNAYRLAGNSFRDSIGATKDQFFPGAVPSAPAALNHFLNYQRDTVIPKHRVRWNWIYDLPFGRRRTFAHNAPNWLNAVIGGWTISGSGTVVSSWFALDSSDWNIVGKPEVYGTKYPILNCTGTPATAKTAADERCYSGYLYWNGYISQKQINSYNANGIPNGYFGLPSNYKPAVTPLTQWPVGGKTTDPNANNYDTNFVSVPLKNGNVQRVTLDNGLNPWRNQYLLGPMNWNLDSSLRKTFRMRESVQLRVTFDVFNVFNLQGLNPPGTNGIASLQSSYGGFGFRPRQAQGSMRLEF